MVRPLPAIRTTQEIAGLSFGLGLATELATITERLAILMNMAG